MRNNIIELLEELKVEVNNGDFHLCKVFELQAWIDFLKNEETAKDSALKALAEHIVELLQANRKKQWTAADSLPGTYAQALAQVQDMIDLL